ncbi:hypothetical protein [Pedobacter psychrodurus]|nr:hypothetical protein [Pedobacter psychrodurus]
MVKYLHDWCKASAGSNVKVLVAEKQQKISSFSSSLLKSDGSTLS